MKLFSILFIMAMITTETLKIDFGKASTHKDWYVINDGVMGGRSKGNITYNEESMVFKGKVSLENNGGFSSMRSADKNWNLEDYTGIRIRFKSETGRNFGFSFETRGPWYAPRYRHYFNGTKGEWTTIEMSIQDFNETRIGEMTQNKISTKAIKDIRRLGIILYDKKAGTFNLEIDYIELY